MNQMTHLVAQATGEKKRGGDLVVESLQNVAQVVTERSAAAEELSATSVWVAQEAERLHGMAADFRIEPGAAARPRASRSTLTRPGEDSPTPRAGPRPGSSIGHVAA